MPGEKRVVVVGGGIVGVSCAYYLASRGAHVTLVERDAADGDRQGASVGNAGIIAPDHAPLPQPGLSRTLVHAMLSRTNPLYIKPRLDPELFAWLWGFWRACGAKRFARSMEALTQLGRISDACFHVLRDEAKIDGGYCDTGRLEIFRTVRGMDEAKRRLELAQQYGFEVERVSGDALRAQGDVWRDEVMGAIRFKEGGYANPGQFLSELTALAVKKGVEIVERAKVVDVRQRRDIARGVGLADGRFIEGNSVVLAAGIWSTRLARAAGIHLPMQAGKGYHVELAGLDAHLETTSVLIESFIGVTPIGQLLRLAGTVELSGINDRIIEKRLEMLRIGARKYIRGIDDAKVVKTWNGLRPMTADGLPVIGPAPNIKGLYIATGHAMMGFMLGPGTGKVISELVYDGQASMEIEAFRVERMM